MTRVTLKEMTWFLIFNLFCISMQICLISSVDTDINTDKKNYYSSYKKNDFNDLSVNNTKNRLLRGYPDDNDVEPDETSSFEYGDIPINNPNNENNENNENSEYNENNENNEVSPTPSTTDVNIIDDHNDHISDVENEDENLQQVKNYSDKVPNTCIVMPEEVERCKYCQDSKFNYGIFKYNTDPSFCEIKNEIANEKIFCPNGWIEFLNYRNKKKFAISSSLHANVFRCTSQKVCCLYS